MASSELVVVLKGGVTASLDALRLGWDLETRGFILRPDGDRLQVSPPERLTREDAVAIRKWKAELINLARYEAPEGEVPQ